MPTTDKVNILLVDDHPENLLALETILSDLNQNLIKVNSGKEALRIMLKKDFAVVLLDIQMPEMDGFETADWIRKRERSHDTPIIFLTAFSREDKQIFKGYQIGGVDYIIKPFNPDILRWKVSVFVDLYKKTEKIKRQYEEIEKLNQKLELSNKELEAFSYSVSHDLRAPLRHINGFSQALIEDCSESLNAQGKSCLKQIIDSTKRMNILIDDLLKLSRITRSEMTFEMVDLSELVRSITTELQKNQPERHVEFSIEDGINVKGDKQLLGIALENLLGNAWKFTGKLVQTKIEFGISQQEDKPAYFVRDNGAGFDINFVNKIFNPFQRLHKASEFPGTGIGLSIVQRIIHRHGGQIWAEGRINEGATFYFTLSHALK